MNEIKSNENKRKHHSLFWLVWFTMIILIGYGTFYYLYPFEKSGTILVKYKGTADEVIIPRGITEIGGTGILDLEEKEERNKYQGAFEGNIYITSVVIPEGVTVIGNSAFKNCVKLTSIEIPDSVVTIEGSAFAGCVKFVKWPLSSDHPHFKRDRYCLMSKNGEKLVACLTTVETCQIPESVKEIDKDAFYSCISLKSVEIPEGVTDIGETAFYKCISLKKIKTPKSLTKIGKHAFYGCSSLSSVVISEGATEIGDDAFKECYNLHSIYIPKSMTKISDSTFDDCSNLTIVVLKGSYAEEFVKANNLLCIIATTEEEALEAEEDLAAKADLATETVDEAAPAAEEAPAEEYPSYE